MLILNSLAYKLKFFQALQLMPLKEKQRKAVSRPRHQHFSYLCVAGKMEHWDTLGALVST